MDREVSEESGIENNKQRKTQMNKKITKKKFTLVELMVVAIIVAILAAVAIPLMSGNVQRAIATEATAALGMIRSNLRAMYAETGDYTTPPSGTAFNDGDLVAGNVPDILAEDLDGHYFSHDCYEIDFDRLTDENSETHDIRIVCDGDDSDDTVAPAADKAAGILYAIYEDGTIEKSTDAGTTWTIVQ